MGHARRGKGSRGAVSRRDLLAGGAGLWVLSSCRSNSESEKGAQVAPGSSLTADELALCAAACERILPADADPGAADLGVPTYIDRRLARRSRRGLRARRRFRRGLALLSRWSVARHGGQFVKLDGDTQDIALASLGAEGGAEGYAFVRQLVVLTLEGAFADPIYGGNRDRRGWKLVGFEAPCPNPHCPR